MKIVFVGEEGDWTYILKKKLNNDRTRTMFTVDVRKVMSSGSGVLKNACGSGVLKNDHYGSEVLKRVVFAF